MRGQREIQRGGRGKAAVDATPRSGPRGGGPDACLWYGRYCYCYCYFYCYCYCYGYYYYYYFYFYYYYYCYCNCCYYYYYHDRPCGP